MINSSQYFIKLESNNMFFTDFFFLHVIDFSSDQGRNSNFVPLSRTNIPICSNHAKVEATITFLLYWMPRSIKLNLVLMC